jgi:hypothetical protein
MTGDTRPTVTVRITFPAFGKATCVCADCGERHEIAAPSGITSRLPGRPRHNPTAAELADHWAMRHASKYHQGSALITEAAP